MKKKSLILAGLCAVLSLAGCINPTSAGGDSTLSTLGPIVAEVAQARIAKEMLDRHPDRAESLISIADALDAISNDATGTEITDALIRGFVARSTAEWQLTAPEQELLTLGLVAAKNRALGASGVSAIRIGDANVGPWIAAVQRGIRAGVAAHRAQL